MTDLEELIAKIRKIIPNASTGTDNYGQIIIYTNLKFVDDWDANQSLEEMQESDFEK